MNILNFYDSLTIEVIAAAVFIAAGALVAWLFWTPKIQRTVSELRRLQSFLNGSAVTGRQALINAYDNTRDVNLRTALREIQSGLFEIPGDLGVKTYSLRFYQEILTPRTLLAKRVNLALYEAAPNLLIGVGLLFTFAFLAIGLFEVMPAFNQRSNDQAVKDALSGLLGNAAGKFVTSIVGMLCSLLWAYFSRRNLEALDDEIEAFCAAMHEHVEDTGSEAAISAQIALLGELLNENREQVGQLRRFETDFAVAIGKALGSQMQPAFERLSATISEALRALTEKVGTMNEDALKKMLQDFQSVIRENSGKEMEAFRQTLIDVSQQIKSAAEKLEGAGGQAGSAIQKSGEEFKATLATGASDLKGAAGLLEQAMITAKATVNDFDATIERAAVEGNSGFTKLQLLLSQLGTTAAEVGSLVSSIQSVSGDFSAAANNVKSSTENLKAIVTEQGNVVSSVTGAANTLSGALTTANQEFRNSAQTMAETTKEMTTGVKNYSEQLVSLHSNLDENLAKAIGSLNSTVSELIDGLEDFLEELNKGRR